MRDLAGIINLAEPTDQLGELTGHRTLGAVPFGGRYRLIDFTLSNMVNAGIRNVGILLADRFGPLLDHIKNGKEWDLDRQRDGLFLLPPAPARDPAVGVFSDLRNLHFNQSYLEKSRQKYVLLTGSNVVCNLNYRRVFEYHQAQGADLTMVYSQNPILQRNPPCTVLLTDQKERVIDLAESPQNCRQEKISLNMYLLSKEILREVVDYCAARNKRDLLRDGFMPRLKKLKVYGFKHQGYAGIVNSLRSYYQHSLELLSPETWQELFFKKGQIHTKVKHEAPVKYGEGCQVRNSLVASGCNILGTVQNSILFRGVQIGPHAVVKNSVVMQKSRLGEEVFLENVILDKDVTISPQKRLVGDPDFPLVIEKLARL